MKVDGINTDTVDELDKVLRSNPAIENLQRFSEGRELFERYFSFSVRNQQYKITWHRNLMLLNIGEFELIFDEVKLASTFPRCYKNFLQFYNDDKLIAAIPLELYKN